MTSRLCWVIAYKVEADAILDRFSMKSVKSTGKLFPVFSSDDGGMELIVSGKGVAQAAAATALLAQRAWLDQVTTCGWINFGIAGQGRGIPGEVKLAAKVSDAATLETWYPQVCWPRALDLPRDTVRTVGTPVADFSHSEEMFEMEASGFMSLASKCSSLEYCQVIKVVSDNAEHDFHQINKQQVGQWCTAAVQRIDPWLGHFRHALARQATVDGPPPAFDSCLCRWHFSETQQHQLRRLLQRTESVMPLPPEEMMAFLAPAKSSRECLTLLQNRLNPL